MARAGLLAGLLLGLLAALLWRPAPGPLVPRDRIAPAILPGARPIEMLALGTSLTARALWPERLAEALAACGLAARVSVAARPGAGSAEGLADVAAAGAGPFAVAFVEFAINDADILDGVTRAESLANHRAILGALKARHPGIAVVLVTTNPVAGLQRLKRPRLAAYGDLYPLLAAEAGASLFDGAARWGGPGPSRAVLPDGLHPDPGVEAALYTPGLAALVTDIFGRRCPG